MKTLFEPQHKVFWGARMLTWEFNDPYLFYDRQILSWAHCWLTGSFKIKCSPKNPATADSVAELHFLLLSVNFISECLFWCIWDIPFHFQLLSKWPLRSISIYQNSYSLQYKYLHALKILSKNKQYNFNEHESDRTIP